MNQTISPAEPHIDFRAILKEKHLDLPRWAVSLLERILRVERINQALHDTRDYQGIELAQQLIEWLRIKLNVVAEEHIPTDGSPIFVANHPLGGPDGLALIAAIGRKIPDVKVPVNDFLMAMPGLSQLFIPIDKVHKNGRNLGSLTEVFAAQTPLLYFPAGTCSRLVHGKVQDLTWHATVVKQAVRNARPIVPIHFNATNRRRFYVLARLRKALGIKFNIEMALLPAEMFAHEGDSITMTIGQPIQAAQFTPQHSFKEWAEQLRQHVYKLEKNPAAPFTA